MAGGRKIPWRDGIPKRDGHYWFQWGVEYSGRKWSPMYILRVTKNKGKPPWYGFIYGPCMTGRSVEQILGNCHTGKFRFAGPICIPDENKKPLKISEPENKSCCM